MPELPLAAGAYVQSYAETKALGELALRAANGSAVSGGGRLATVAVAPHQVMCSSFVGVLCVLRHPVRPCQVYGPRDNLFLPNVLEAGGSGRLRIFGPGKNRICFTHVDNYGQWHCGIIPSLSLFESYYTSHFSARSDPCGASAHIA